MTKLRGPSHALIKNRDEAINTFFQSFSDNRGNTQFTTVTETDTMRVPTHSASLEDTFSNNKYISKKWLRRWLEKAENEINPNSDFHWAHLIPAGSSLSQLILRHPQ